MCESSLTFHPPAGEVELAYAVTGTPDGELRIASTNPELPVKLAIDGHLSLTGDASVGGKLFVAGSIDPTDLSLNPQRRTGSGCRTGPNQGPSREASTTSEREHGSGWTP